MGTDADAQRVQGDRQGRKKNEGQGRNWAHLDPLGVLFYLFGAHLGPFGAHFLFVWGPLGPIWGPFYLGPYFGPILALPAIPVLALFWSLLGGAIGIPVRGSHCRSLFWLFVEQLAQ